MYGINIALILAACADAPADVKEAKEEAAQTERAVEKKAKQEGQTIGQAIDNTVADAERTVEDLGSTIDNGVENIKAESADAAIATKVRAALAKEADLRDASIEVKVDNGVVTLTGVTASLGDKLRATAVANEQAGVGRVKNELKVG